MITIKGQQLMISEKDTYDLELVLDEDIANALRVGISSVGVKIAVKKVDQLIRTAPPLTAPMIIYKIYKGAPTEFRNGEVLTDPAFFTGSTTKPQEDADSVVIALTVPIGTNVLDLSDGSYVLDRGLTIELTPTKTGPIPGTIEDGVKASISLLPHVELYNKSHDEKGRFSPGTSKSPQESTSKNDASTPTKDAPEKEHHRIRTLAKIVTYPVVVSTLILGLLIHHHHEEKEKKELKKLMKDMKERKKMEKKARETERRIKYGF